MMAAERLSLLSSGCDYWPVMAIDPFVVVRLTTALPVPRVVAV